MRTALCGTVQRMPWKWPFPNLQCPTQWGVAGICPQTHVAFGVAVNCPCPAPHVCYGCCLACLLLLLLPLGALLSVKPEAIKGGLVKYVRTAYLASTMGPSVPVDVASLADAVAAAAAVQPQKKADVARA